MKYMAQPGRLRRPGRGLNRKKIRTDHPPPATVNDLFTIDEGRQGRTITQLDQSQVSAHQDPCSCSLGETDDHLGGSESRLAKIGNGSSAGLACRARVAAISVRYADLNCCMVQPRGRRRTGDYHSILMTDSGDQP
jgi:hypothetical protein